MLRRLYGLAMETQYMKVLVRYTNHYSMWCTRLARLLRAEKGIRSRLVEVLKELIDEVIIEVYEEWDLSLGS